MAALKLVRPLSQPASCNGCPLHGVGEGFMNPSLSSSKDRYNVALVGEALGETEVTYGAPFMGKAGFKLTRLIEWAGLEREKFDIWNTVWCRPPDNKLEGEDYEFGATSHCRAAHWDRLLSRARVVVPMGNVPLGVFTHRKGILKTRGYVQPGPLGSYLLPTVHPSFIQRGQSKYSAAFIHDLQKAVELARLGEVPTEGVRYTLDPTPDRALHWARQYRERLEKDPSTLLAYDIETPGKGEDESDSDEDDPTYFIWRIGFAFEPYRALSIPWTAAYIPAIRLLLESDGDKVVWNAGFDNPRIRHNGVEIRGTIHDGMVAWHILHSDLPKGLGFVATFTCPWQSAWKHLSGSQPAYYNATDADVELRSFLRIRDELQQCGMWEVYQTDVLDLEPILIHMHNEGMPLDHEVRVEKVVELDKRIKHTIEAMEAVVPLEARKVEHVYKNRPKDTTGLLEREGDIIERVCESCGLARPKKDHFKVYKTKHNPCGGSRVIERSVRGVEYYRLGKFRPSRHQLIKYQETLERPVPTTWDNKTKTRKVSMNEKAIKGLMVKYPDDKLYPLVLEYRELDKVAGTYLGKLDEDAIQGQAQENAGSCTGAGEEA